MVMKKLMFALALVSLVFTSAQAQKQLGGEHNVEVNLTPFGDSPIDGTTLKYRNFLDDDKALRISLILNTASDTYTYLNEGEISVASAGGGEDIPCPQLHMYTNTTVFGLAAGYEMHFGGTDNLSPYFGFEGYGVVTSRTDDLQLWGPNATDVSITGYPEQWTKWTLTNQQSVSTFGLNLVLGADYYFNDAIYIGFETGLGFGVSTVSPHTISASDNIAFNIAYNDASTSEQASAELDSFNGQMPFDVIDGVIYDNGSSTWSTTLEGVGPGIGGAIDNTTYEDDGTRPNFLSGFNAGNVFNASLRFGFLFD
jgi:hypothetical protein